ncbi:MAG: precorrin-6A synthase (deacetylating) [Streptosporangiaceae bacterium]
MRKVMVIGIGAGDPEQITVQAINALNQVRVFFVLDKGEAKDELVELRREILDRHVQGEGYRVVYGRDPERDRGGAAYTEDVDDWRRRRAEVCAELIEEHLEPDATGAFLVWGDPALYDSTLAILDDLNARGMGLEIEMIPGVSSVAALTARHRTALNRVGRPVQITTGRRLAEGWPEGVDDLVVMLDARTSFTGLDPAHTEIFWGAYLGTPDEILISGPLGEVADQIVTARAAARDRKGWIMDTYLLRRSP